MNGTLAVLLLSQSVAFAATQDNAAQPVFQHAVQQSQVEQMSDRKVPVRMCTTVLRSNKGLTSNISQETMSFCKDYNKSNWQSLVFTL